MHEFMSPSWIDAVGEIVRRRAAADPPVADFSFCEVFVDPPPHLAQEDGRVAWHCVASADGAVRVGPGEIEADHKVVADYAAALSLSRVVFSEHPEMVAEAQRVAAQAAAEGKLVTTQREGATPPAFLATVHDEIAAVTA